MSHTLKSIVTHQEEESPINYELLYTDNSKVHVMKDGCVFAWTISDGLDPALDGKPCRVCPGFVGYAYKTLDDFNRGEYYYKGGMDETIYKVDRYEFDGHGLFYWPNGDHYIGNFFCGFLDGSGVYTCSDGNKYEGGFDSDFMCGEGTFTWSNGNSYCGHFFDGAVDPAYVGTFTFGATGESVTSKPDGIMSLVSDMTEYVFTLQEAVPRLPKAQAQEDQAQEEQAQEQDQEQKQVAAPEDTESTTPLPRTFTIYDDSRNVHAEKKASIQKAKISRMRRKSFYQNKNVTYALHDDAEAEAYFAKKDAECTA